MAVAVAVAVAVRALVLGRARGVRAHAPRRARPAGAGEAEAHVLDVGDDLFEQLGDVVVVELVDDLAPIALTGDQAKVAQQPQLVRDRGALHPDRAGDVVDRGRAGVQPREDAQAARRGQSLQPLGRRAGVAGVADEAGEVGGTVGHLDTGYLKDCSALHAVIRSSDADDGRGGGRTAGVGSA